MTAPDTIVEAVDELGDMRSEVDTAAAVVRIGTESLDKVTGAWLETETELTELAETLEAIRGARKYLAQIESAVEAKTAQAMRKNEQDAGPFHLKRASGNERKNWDHERVAGRIVESALEAVAGDLEQAPWMVRDMFLQAATPSWRVTALKERGVEFGDCCEVERKRRTVQVYFRESTGDPS